MSNDTQEKARFVEDLRKIVCSTAPAQPFHERVGDGYIDHLIDTFGKITGHEFTQEQRDLLTDGVCALMEINDKRDLSDSNLIKNNIDLFIGNVEQALQTTLGRKNQRLLTRALLRLIADGRREAGEVERPHKTPPRKAFQDEARRSAATGQPNQAPGDEKLPSDVKAAIADAIDKVMAGAPQEQTSENLLRQIEQALLRNGNAAARTNGNESRNTAQKQMGQMFGFDARTGGEDFPMQMYGWLPVPIMFVKNPAIAFAQMAGPSSDMFDAISNGNELARALRSTPLWQKLDDELKAEIQRL